jgi:hypothetical protein
MLLVRYIRQVYHSPVFLMLVSGSQAGTAEIGEFGATKGGLETLADGGELSSRMGSM